MIKTVRYLLFILLLLHFSCDKKQNSNLADANNDSIAKYLKLAGNDSLSFPERDKWNEKAFSLVFPTKNSHQKRFFLNKIISNYYDLNMWDNYDNVNKILLENSRLANDKSYLAKAMRYKGNCFYKYNVIDSAYYYYLKSEKLCLETKDKENYAIVLLKKGIIQIRINDYLGADLSLMKAYKIFKYTNDNQRIFATLTSIGTVSCELKEYNKAIKYYNQALKVAKENKLQTSEYQEEITLNNIGIVYSDLKNHIKAINYYKKALLNKKLKENDPELYAIIIDNLAYSKFKSNNYNDLPELFFKSFKIRDSLKNISGLVFNNRHISEYYFKTKDTFKARKFAEEALKKARFSKKPSHILNSLLLLGNINKDRSPECFDEFDKLTDSLLFEERKTRNQFYRIQLETDEINQEKETAIKQKWVLSSIISSVLLIVILLFVIYRQRAKQKELQLLQIQQKGNEEIYHLMLNQQAKVEEARQIEKKRIALELHDGIMNKLASTRLNLFVLSKKSDRETINKCLTYIEDIHQIENEIRNVSHELNQELFTEKESFKTLLKQFVTEQNSHLKNNYELQIDENINWDLISSEIKMHLYRIIQEATRNSNKHAKATKTFTCFTMDENQLSLSITDNGIGFDSEKTKDGIGLLNMQQRVQSVNGTLSITSKVKKGTTIYIKIPM